MDGPLHSPSYKSTRKISISCGRLQPTAASLGSFGPNDVAQPKMLKISLENFAEIHLENFVEICLKILTEIRLDNFVKIRLKIFAEINKKKFFRNPFG